MNKTNSKNYFSLNPKIIQNIISETSPSCQAESINESNLGFGFIYYSLARIFKPKTTLVFGATKGFSPVCFGLGIKDNQNKGTLYFVDAGYSDQNDGLNKGMGGIGFWKNIRSVHKLFRIFNLEETVKPHIMKTSKFLKFYKRKHIPNIDLLFIDADHSYDGFKFDFENFLHFLNINGIIIFHDVLVEEGHDDRNFGVKKYFEEKIMKNPSFESFRFPIWPGLCILRKIKNKKFQ